jgi:hypothetical protein
MPSQYKGFCYPTQAEAVAADIGFGAIESSAGVASPISYTVTNTTTVAMTYSYKPFSTVAASNVIHTRVYPLCTDIGRINDNSGISVADALTVSWLVVLVWAAAFYFKTFRTGARGY